MPRGAIGFWNATTQSVDYSVGKEGKEGIQGQRGLQGLQGNDGPQGSIADHDRGTWMAGTLYAKDDITHNAGSVYFAKVAHTSGATFDATKWGILATDASTPANRLLLRSGWWYAAAGQHTSNLTMVNQRVYAVPFHLTVAATISGLALNIQTAGVGTAPVLRYGLAADDGAGLPGALILDCGTTSAAATTTKYTGFTAQPVAAGVLWVLIALQGSETTAAVCRANAWAPGAGIDNSSLVSGADPALLGGVWHNALVSGALPTPIAAATNVGSSWSTTPRVLIKIQ